MTHIIIDYLSEEDRTGLAYRAVKNEIDSLNPIRCNNSDRFLQALSFLNTDNDPLIITILSHGHLRGITFGTYASLITWCELCEKLNFIRTNNSLTLNLIAICNSHLIIPYKISLGVNIDRIWVSTNTVISINKGLLASKENEFSNFVNKLDDKEKSLYAEFR